jgi:tRNA (guanine37-N1)-methyltransferase
MPLTTKRRYIPSSFDIIGSRDKAVAVVEIPEGPGKKAVAEAVMSQHKNVRSVFLKASERKGIYRLRALKLIAGSKNSEVIHIEYGCRLLLDPCKVYFSPREGSERMRLAETVRPGETVMVFFAGVGSFPIVISRKSMANRIVGIELNPVAVGYFRKNIKLNKTENILVVEGDVKEKAPNFYGSCTRVIMPLPESAIDYLEYAIKCLKKNGVIHLYCFSKEDEIKNVIKTVSSICAKYRSRCTVSATAVLPHSPRMYKYRLDCVMR